MTWASLQIICLIPSVLWSAHTKSHPSWVAGVGHICKQFTFEMLISNTQTSDKLFVFPITFFQLLLMPLFLAALRCLICSFPSFFFFLFVNLLFAVHCFQIPSQWLPTENVLHSLLILFHLFFWQNSNTGWTYPLVASMPICEVSFPRKISQLDRTFYIWMYNLHFFQHSTVVYSAPFIYAR